MNKVIFRAVADSLVFIGRKTGLTYNEVNIVVYYFLIPFSWLCLLDEIFDVHHGKTAAAIFVMGFIAGCTDFKGYSDRLFRQSVSFLNFFNRYGSNYVASSVFICVALPVAVYGLMIYFAFS